MSEISTAFYQSAVKAGIVRIDRSFQNGAVIRREQKPDGVLHGQANDFACVLCRGRAYARVARFFLSDIF